MRIPPLSVIETWPTPNYSDPNTRGPSSLILNIVFIAMVMVAVAIRYYCRLCIKKWFGWDDIMIAMALVREYLTAAGQAHTDIRRFLQLDWQPAFSLLNRSMAGIDTSGMWSHLKFKMPTSLPWSRRLYLPLRQHLQDCRFVYFTIDWCGTADIHGSFGRYT